jgi:hypothetical protein
MEHLGHSSISVTMDRYGHLFPDEKERLVKGLDDTLMAAKTARDVGFSWGKEGADVLQWRPKSKKLASDQPG